MPERPLVSIITVVSNLYESGLEKYLKECIRAVRNQTYGNVEHIIIDNASSDVTLDLLKKYSSKGIIRYVSDPFSNAAVGMNMGIERAQGEYIAILDIDERYYINDAIRLSVEAIEKNGAVFSYADAIILKRDEIKIVKGELEKFIYAMPFSYASMFAKRAVILALNKFDETYETGFKYDLIERMVLKDMLAN